MYTRHSCKYKQYFYKITSTSDNIKRTELQPPSAGDIKETKMLLNDLEIKKDIPEFKTKAELYNWRSRIVRGN